ncbi:hypothetical protein [Dactylosporangium sp. NPDC051541]|uniref:hypothetical protein n=1 Tax=Dactylosporangium sp. NPDC051541 TaxID=3363977 RepID=UPI0037ADA99F
MAVVFVHGITVRTDQYTELLSKVVDGFAAAGGKPAVSGCYWGDLGRAASYSGVSIPGFTVPDRRSAGPPADGNPATALMLLLLEEPLAELADLRAVDDDFQLYPRGFRPVPPAVRERNARLAAALPQVAERLAGDDPQTAAKQVAAVFAAAASTRADLDLPTLRPSIGRALLAASYRAEAEADDLAAGFAWNAAAVAIEEALDSSIGGQRSIFTRVGASALTLALRHGLRSRVMPGLSLFLGDVFAWFHRRDEILDKIDAAVLAADAGGPLVLVGHSLGGVILFDYCARAGRDVALLATVGSQVGLFGEMGVTAAATTPARIGRWINYYDPDDALSFLAGPVFDRVVDEAMPTNAPFPVAHGEYWNLPRMYTALAGAVSAL